MTSTGSSGPCGYAGSTGVQGTAGIGIQTGTSGAWVPNSSSWSQWPISNLIKIANPTLDHCPHCLKKTEDNVYLCIEKVDSSIAWTGCPSCFHALIISLSNRASIYEQLSQLQNAVFKLLTYGAKLLQPIIKRDKIFKKLVAEAQHALNLSEED
jgi:hypothetical protein